MASSTRAPDSHVVIEGGTSPATTQLTVVAVHGRDQTPRYMMENVAEPLSRPGVRWILPAAPNQSWYSGKASDLRDTNQSELDVSLQLLCSALEPLAPERTVLVGFSQGACLVAELLASQALPFAGAALLTGTLLGPRPAERMINGRLDDMPIVMGVGARDPWMTTVSATDTQHVLCNAGAIACLHVVDSDEHKIHAEDLAATSRLIDQLLEEIRSQ